MTADPPSPDGDHADLEPAREMTDNRPGPHPQFTFLVDLGGREAGGREAGFGECSIGGAEVTAAGFPAGADPNHAGGKVGSRHTASEVTLKRGNVDSNQLSGWLGADRDQVRSVRVALVGDDGSARVATWVLDGARIVRFVSRPADVDVDGSDLAVDELRLACEAITLEGPE